MRRVRDEPLLLREGALQTVEEVVDDPCKTDQFLTAADWEPLVQIGRADRGCVRGHRRQWREAALRDEVAAGCGDDEERRNREKKDLTNSREDVLGVTERIRSGDAEPFS